MDVGPTKLREEIRKRRLRARKFGRKTIITAFDLEDWVARLPDIHDVAPITVEVSRVQLRHKADALGGSVGQNCLGHRTPLI